MRRIALWALFSGVLACGAGRTDLTSVDAGGAGGSTSTGTGSGSGSGTGSGTTTGTGTGTGTTTGIGGGGGGGGLPICSWAAEEPEADGTYNASLAESDCSLLFESPYAGERTSQTSGATLRRGFVTGDARARNAGDGWGLSIESERTNAITHSDSWQGASWVAGTMSTVASQADPAGGTAATMFISDALEGQYSHRQTAYGQVASTWARGGDCGPGGGGGAGGADTGECAWLHHALPSVLIEGASWRRYDAAHPTGSSTDNLMIDTRGGAPNPYAIGYYTETIAFGAQLEEGARYPSSYIPTTDAAASRDAELLYSDIPAELIPGGYFEVSFVLAPRYASGELPAAAEHDLLWLDDENRVFLRAHPSGGSGAALCLLVGGSQLCGGHVTWPRERELTITAEHSASRRAVSISGQQSGNGDTYATAGLPINMSNYDYVLLLGDGDGAQQCADLRSLGFVTP